jgi:hypothetical protein
MFAQLLDRVVPTVFRVVVDGDIVSSVPPAGFGYKHGGTEVIVDSIGAGSMIVDPSFVEKRLRTQSKSSVRVHSLLVYRKGLNGVKSSSEYMRNYVRDLPEGQALDTVRLALFAVPVIPDTVIENDNNNYRNKRIGKDTLSPPHKPIPTDSCHGEEGGGRIEEDNSIDISLSSIDISNNFMKSNDNMMKNNIVPYDFRSHSNNSPTRERRISSVVGTGVETDTQYGEEMVLHHNDDVKQTEEIVSHWKLQQSLRVVPFVSNRRMFV